MVASSFANVRGCKEVTLTALTNNKGLTFVCMYVVGGGFGLLLFFNVRWASSIVSSQHSMKRLLVVDLIQTEWKWSEHEGVCWYRWISFTDICLML